jgi:tagatose-1,6-bisphosphate aldolase/sugar (pentulose or hexulose) kinase
VTSTGLVAGLDLGSTGFKLLVTDRAGVEIATAQVPTPWRPGPGGTAELDAGEVVAAVRTLLAAAATRLADLVKLPDVGRIPARIEALAVSGMGETGVLIDARGAAAAPAFAWFDPRGAQQALAFPPDVRAEFAGRTGLPLGAQVSVAKLAHLRDGGLRLRGLRWLNLPEFVVGSLGGQVSLEPSLLSRTGLVEADTGEPWPAMLEVLGVPDSFLPERVDAGACLGRADADAPPVVRDALLTVAGHDHLVAAEAGIGLPDRHYHVSMGTAEVLLRVIDAPLGFEARSRLAGALVNEVRHVVPGRHVLVAGLKTGLLLRRVLQVAGIRDRTGRDVLDAAVMELPYEGALADGAVEVSGARNDDGVLRFAAHGDGVSPAELFAAVLRHSNEEIGRLVAAMDAELPPAASSTLTGGWTGMASVRRARRQALPQMSVSAREQETAYGAALVAARLLASAGPTAATPTPSATPDGRRTPPMNPLTTIERRGMSGISTPSGRMLIVAADQRNGMKAAMQDAVAGPDSISTSELAEAKADLLRYLANEAPAILLDPEVALPGVVDEGVLARNTSLVVGMDASGYRTSDGLRFTRYVPGVTAARVRELGGDVAKMLWYVRPDRQDAESLVAGEMRALLADCETEGLLLIVELLTYQLDGEPDADYRAAFGDLVAGGTALAVACGAKVLKLQYPGSAEACAAVTKAADGVPWAVLSAGVDHTTFLGQVRTAMANGASGAMAGRSLWKDSLSVSPDRRREYLTSRALPRLRELADVVEGRA